MSIFFMRYVSAADSHVHSGVPTVAELLADGWEELRPHPLFPNSILMRKTIEEPCPTAN